MIAQAAEGGNVAAAVRVGRCDDGLYIAQRSTAGPDHVVSTLTDVCRTLEQAEMLACAALLSVKGGEAASAALRSGEGDGADWCASTEDGVRRARVTDGTVRINSATLDAALGRGFIGGLSGTEARKAVAAVDPKPDELDRAVFERM